MTSTRYPNALAPIRVGGLELRNRIFVPAHTTNYGRDHLPSERHLAYHRARARGGAGLVIFESIRVQRNTVGRPQGVAGYDPRCVAPFARIARAPTLIVKERQFVERHGLHSAITSPLCGTAVESVVVTLAESGAMHRRANSMGVKVNKTGTVIVTQ